MKSTDFQPPLTRFMEYKMKEIMTRNEVGNTTDNTINTYM